LHRRPLVLHHRTISNPHGSYQGRRSRSARRPANARLTIAEALKPLGYATGQFGKNHLGDRDEYLPTNQQKTTGNSTLKLEPEDIQFGKLTVEVKSGM
jgi:arylsulfatase A-like enzyme